MTLDGATRAYLRRRVDEERRRTVRAVEQGGGRTGAVALAAWEAAGGDPLRALLLALEHVPSQDLRSAA